jgi:hypothetical protein
MSLFDRYGIKEVADVTFYALDDYGNVAQPVLYLDTLKVSTVEQTAENSDARGGKGNTALMTWDYGKEITVNLEDALFSNRSLEVMYEGKVLTKSGKVRRTKFVNFKNDFMLCDPSQSSPDYEVMTAVLPAEIGEWKMGPNDHVLIAHHELNETMWGRASIVVNDVEIPLNREISRDTLIAAGFASEVEANGDIELPKGLYMVTMEWDQDRNEIEISSNSFPGTYYVTGETFARNEQTGEDEIFQLVFPKVKVLSESNTITMEADGDPTVFNMSLKVLKSKNAPMMSLI